MALTETRPETDASPTRRQASPTTIDGLLGSADHKTVGRLWIGAGLVLLLGSLLVSLVAAFEASDLDDLAVVTDPDEFAQLWSLGRELLLYGSIVPILIGLATYLVPLQIGAPALAFARGAAGAFWTWVLATGLSIGAYLLNGGPGGGRADFVVLWAAALGLMLAALVWALVILATTIIGARTTGMTLDRTAQTTWSFLVFSLIGILALPVLIAELVLVYVRVRHGFVPLEARATLTRVLESSSLAPGLYWVAIPVLGMGADIIGVHTSRPVRAHRAVMAAIGALGILAFGADYFGFGSVRPFDFNHELLVLTIAAAILPILAVLGLSADSLRHGEPKITAALVGSLVAGLLLMLGATASLLGLIEPVALFLDQDAGISVDLDRLLVLNGTTFHDGIRGLVLGATIVALIGALHHWAPKIWGRRMREPLGMLAILVAAAGAVLWGLGAILAGVDDQPAYPVATLGGGDNVELFNVIAMIGIALVAVGALVTALNAAQAAFGRNLESSADAWSGATLEWATSSPPSFGNFDKPPVVRSATPLADTLEAIDESEVVIEDAARADAEGESAGDEAASESEVSS